MKKGKDRKVKTQADLLEIFAREFQDLPKRLQQVQTDVEPMAEAMGIPQEEIDGFKGVAEELRKKYVEGLHGLSDKIKAMREEDEKGEEKT